MAEMQGRQQRDLWLEMRTKKYTKLNEMTNVLIAWQRKGWVDKYRVHNNLSKRPKTVWRATKLLRDDWKDG